MLHLDPATLEATAERSQAASPPCAGLRGHGKVRELKTLQEEDHEEA
jgi:hypothetical protein